MYASMLGIISSGWLGMRAGYPFGCMFGLLYLVIENCTEEKGHASLILLVTLLGPIALICDIILFIPTLSIRALHGVVGYHR